MYWYHPDYLGSVEAVTNAKGEVYQFFHNTIWGEPIQQQKAFLYNSFSSRYRFNGKKWDEETGNFCCGARYEVYPKRRIGDPKISMWLSVDPKAEWYPGQSPYHFSLNNPINFKDPNGMWVEGAGFWNNLLYSDKRNEAMMMAGENGSFWKTEDGWKVSRPTQTEPIQCEGYFNHEVLDDVEVIDIFDNGERSVDDHAINAVRGLANIVVVLGTALTMPFIALYNNDIKSNRGHYKSPRPFMIREDEGFRQLDDVSKQEAAKEAMKATVGAILFATPVSQELNW